MPDQLAQAWPVIAALAVAGACTAGVLSVARAAGSRHGVTRTRLASISASPVPEAGTAALATARPWRRDSGSLLQRELRRAGLAWQPSDLVVTTVAVGTPVAVVVGMLTHAAPAAAAAGIGAGAIVVLAVRRRAVRRAAALNAQVVDLIDVLVSSLRAGFGLLQSLEMAAREQRPPLSDEIGQVILEMQLGVGAEDALDHLVTRTGDADLDLVVTAVAIQRRVGGNLSEVLGNIAETIRDRIRIRGEIRTLTAQMRMSAGIIGLLPVVLGVIMGFMQPQHMALLLTDPVGRGMLVAGMVLEVIGFVLVRRIGVIKY